jgi:thiamine biosynthesis protein ThiI
MHREESFQERIVCLLSGGMDSPVAAWLAIRKGCTPVFVYFDNSPFGDETTKERALEAIKKLKNCVNAKSANLYIVPHGPALGAILRNCRRNLTCLLCRRMMYRLAERIAMKEKAEAIVTGEIIGEHASQTLRNLRVENEAISKVTVLRPLIGMNKTEVESIATRIKTFDASVKRVSCCTCAPPTPRTRARLEEILKAETKLNITSMIERGLEHARQLNLRTNFVSAH